jgi:tetratricopeptide (TPR) repeat protein
MVRRVRPLLTVLFLAGTGLAVLFAAARVKQDASLDEARQAYEASDYAKAIQTLQAAATKDPQNGDLYLLLTKSYLELEQLDAAIKSGERAVAIDPQSSKYHEWLGKAYGEKADHSGPFAAIGWAKKAGREFEAAVRLDARNFSARQALIEFDCSAPGFVGGGEDKAQPHIRELLEMDSAEGHYAAGNCRRQKKDFKVADEEFTQALESQPKSPELIYDIGDYAVKRGQAERLIAVADAGEHVAPTDPRGKFYRAVGLILKMEKPGEAEPLLQEYLKKAPKRNGFPRAAAAHVWLGRLYKDQNRTQDAIQEFETALQLDPKNKMAQEELKKLKKR